MEPKPSAKTRSLKKYEAPAEQPCVSDPGDPPLDHVLAVRSDDPAKAASAARRLSTGSTAMPTGWFETTSGQSFYCRMTWCVPKANIRLCVTPKILFVTSSRRSMVWRRPDYGRHFLDCQPVRRHAEPGAFSFRRYFRRSLPQNAAAPSRGRGRAKDLYFRTPGRLHQFSDRGKAEIFEIFDKFQTEGRRFLYFSRLAPAWRRAVSRVWRAALSRI